MHNSWLAVVVGSGMVDSPPSLLMWPLAVKAHSCGASRFSTRGRKDLPTS